MKDWLRRLTARHEDHVDGLANLKAGVAAIVGLCLIGWLATIIDLPLLLAPMGATAALLFGQPSSPLAQPMNVVCGYLIGTVVCELAFMGFPDIWVAGAVAVGCTVVIMRALRVTHPPAGAVPILGFGNGIHGTSLLLVIMAGVAILVAIALVVHAIPPRRTYPLRLPNK